jgi:hypothetical protein
MRFARAASQLINVHDGHYVLTKQRHMPGVLNKPYHHSMPLPHHEGKRARLRNAPSSGQ